MRSRAGALIAPAPAVAMRVFTAMMDIVMIDVVATEVTRRVEVVGHRRSVMDWHQTLATV